MAGGQNSQKIRDFVVIIHKSRPIVKSRASGGYRRGVAPVQIAQKLARCGRNMRLTGQREGEVAAERRVEPADGDAVRHTEKKPKDKDDSWQVSVFLLVLVVIGYGICVGTSVPEENARIQQDIGEHAYVTVHGSYARNTASRRSHTSFTMTIYTDDDPETPLCLEPPVLDDPDAFFPHGTHNGTIVYAKNSCLILKFTPDNHLAPSFYV